MKELVVVGGGITGLASAYLAARHGVKVTLIESSGEVGGLLRTFSAGGSRLECFYHHAFTHDAELRWLLRELGLEDRLEFHPGSMGVLRDGCIYPFNSPGDLLRFKPLRLLDKVRFGLSSLYLSRWAKWRDWESAPALDWFERHAGRRTTEALWGPLLKIKFGPYADQVPLAWMVGRMRQRVNSRHAGGEKLGYLRGSLQGLLDALLKVLAKLGVRIVTDCPVQEVDVHGGAVTGLRAGGQRFQGEGYLFTIPTTQLASLLQPALPKYAEELRRVEYFGAVCVVLELSHSLLPVYWLNIADPGYPFGGIIEHTRLISPEVYGGRHVVYLSRYFAATDPMASESIPAVRTLMLAGLKRACPRFREADVVNVNMFMSRTAAVVSDLNFSQKVPACRTPVGRMFLACMAHIYPDERSCNNSIRVAAEACRVMGVSAQVPGGASLSGQINMDGPR